MRKRVIYSLILLVLCLKGFTQNLEFVNNYLKTADSITYFAVDALNCFYFKDLSNVYTKINPDNNKVLSLKNNEGYGNLTIDVVNPFKVLVFNSNENKIQFYDQSLSIVSSIDFEDFEEISEEIFVINSSDNKIWVYDKQQNKLFKYNYISKNLMESEDLKWISDEGFNPIYFQEVGKNVMMQSEDFKVILFDTFGKKYKNYDFFEERVIGIYQQKIYFWNKNKNITFYDMIKNEKLETKYSIPSNSIIFMRNQQIFYIYERKIFQLNLD